MATKDFVYLGLIAFSALVFYLHGYYAGATLGWDRSGARKRESNGDMPLPAPATSARSPHGVERIGLGNLTGSRSHTQAPKKLELVESVHCFFGNN